MNIFLSYGREDEASAWRLYRDLERLGHPPWFDRVSLTAGQRWKPAIIRAMREADFVIVLLSRKSMNRRGFLNREISEALDILVEQPETRSFLIPTMLEKCEVSHIALADLQWVDLYPDWDEGLRQIIKAVGLVRGTPNDTERCLRAYMICRIDGQEKLLFSILDTVKRLPYVELIEPLHGEDDFIIIISAISQRQLADAVHEIQHVIMRFSGVRRIRTLFGIPPHELKS